jgi:hypothetical protein
VVTLPDVIDDGLDPLARLGGNGQGERGQEKGDNEGAA